MSGDGRLNAEVLNALAGGRWEHSLTVFDRVHKQLPDVEPEAIHTTLVRLEQEVLDGYTVEHHAKFGWRKTVKATLEELIARQIVSDGWGIFLADPSTGTVERAGAYPWEETIYADPSTAPFTIDWPSGLDYHADFDPAEYIDSAEHVRFHLGALIDDGAPFYFGCVEISAVDLEDEDNYRAVGWALLAKVVTA